MGSILEGKSLRCAHWEHFPPSICVFPLWDKNGKYFIYPEGKIFGLHIRYVKIRRAMAPEWLTIKQSGSQGAHYKALIINLPRGAPLDLRHTILISPTGAPKPHITLTVGNKLIGFLIYATLLCKLNTQIIFSPEQLDIRVPPGPF